MSIIFTWIVPDLLIINHCTANRAKATSSLESPEVRRSWGDGEGEGVVD